jgi:hypothetical protein
MKLCWKFARCVPGPTAGPTFCMRFGATAFVAMQHQRGWAASARPAESCNKSKRRSQHIARCRIIGVTGSIPVAPSTAPGNAENFSFQDFRFFGVRFAAAVSRQSPEEIRGIIRRLKIAARRVRARDGRRCVAESSGLHFANVQAVESQ